MPEYPKHPREIETWDPYSKPKTVQKTSAEILEQLVRQLTLRGVGFNNRTVFFSELSNQLNPRPTYPPYDILSSGEDKYEIRMALAGFKKEDIEVTFQDQVLTVKNINIKTEENEDAYFHKGIAARDFTQSFPLSEYVLVTSAEMEDGILTICLERELPKELKPKTIKIK
jgi:molecular chaperone IbpA